MNDISSLSIHLPPVLHLNMKQYEFYEQTIRDMAGTVCGQVATRKSHPSYVGKTEIRTALAHLDGAIGLYMVATGQATHAGVPRLAKFSFPETADRVATARRLVEEL